MKIEYHKITTTWARNDHTTIVACICNAGVDVIVGTVMVDYSGDDKKDAFIWNLYVRSDLMRNCIGTQLLYEAEQDAKERDCESISLEWQAIDTDGWTLDWYKRQGYNVDTSYCRAGVVRMTKRLQEKRGGRK